MEKYMKCYVGYLIVKNKVMRIHKRYVYILGDKKKSVAENMRITVNELPPIWEGDKLSFRVLRTRIKI